MVNDNEKIDEINLLINERTKYGIRDVFFSKNAKVISWSNAQKKWIYYGKQTGTTFDANQVVIPDISEKQLNLIIDQLEELPLYKFSFESSMM